MDPADLERETFDLVVIGAGVNGAGIARDAAMRGLKTLLVDKGDIASGTTSWSSRLIHGGLRYLEHGEVRLVRESLRERERLLRNAAHLVKPIPIIVPIYEGNRRRPATIRAGMTLYDGLSFDKSLPRHRMWSKRQALREAPGLNREGLLGAARYYDAQATFAERLAVENAISAHQHGAVVLTYHRVDGIRQSGDRVTGVTLSGTRSGDRIEVAARCVINVAGPWVDEVLTGIENVPRLIGGTKGSHLVVDRFPGAPDAAFFYEARADGRPILIVPWNGQYLIGSTDIRYDGDLDRVQTAEREIAYLLNELNEVIPSAKVTPTDVHYAYAGVRPLPYQPGDSEAAISRDHAIVDHGKTHRGLLSITGGKLTTYRALAEHAVDAAFRQLGQKAPPCETARLPLPGAAGVSIPAFRNHFLATSGLPEKTANRLVDVYGARATDVIALAKRNGALLEPLGAGNDAIGAEVVFAFERELAQTLADVMLRRSMLGLNADLGVGVDRAMAVVAIRHLGWSNARANAEADAYRGYIARFSPWRNSPSSRAFSSAET
ncbi:MAG: glycerol-3-phosphate dehydrogenase [Chloroflexota bacterium]|nr:glycerol-3-phosphate dehydrogenase [Chloroflexia bacterium]MDQ3227662.1 glycerol-3-phosphate dehydrogenase [Chloroflexota bacterium]